MSEKNIVYEWATKIKDAAEEGIAVYAGNVDKKNRSFSKIIGLCEGILCTMNCVEEPKHCKDCYHFENPAFIVDAESGRRKPLCACPDGRGRLGGGGDDDICEKFKQIITKPLRRCADCQHFRPSFGRYICEVTLQEIDKDMVAIDPEGDEPDCLSFKEREDVE